MPSDHGDLYVEKVLIAHEMLSVESFLSSMFECVPLNIFLAVASLQPGECVLLRMSIVTAEGSDQEPTFKRVQSAFLVIRPLLSLS